MFEYASNTAIFLMPEKEAQEASLAKVNLTTLASQDDAFSYTDPKKDIAERDEEVTTSSIFHDFCKSLIPSPRAFWIAPATRSASTSKIWSIVCLM